MKHRGFTLIELMIVVAIIAIIAAIAIPNLMRSRMQANEHSAVLYIQALSGAEDAYAKSHNGKYTADFAELKAAKQLPAGDYSQGVQGYKFALGVVDDGKGYVITAEPVAPGRTGWRCFYADKTGVIRQENAKPATATSPKAN